MDDISGVLLAEGECGAKSLSANVSWDDYKAIQAINPSTVVHGAKSMRHLLNAWNNPSPSKACLAWGRAIHCLLFEPDQFESRYAECDVIRNPRHNAYKDWLADNEGKEALTAKDMTTTLKAAKCFLADPDVQELIAAGMAEVTLLTVEDGVQCKGRVDFLQTALEVITDLKSTRNIESRACSRDFYRYQYDVKLGLYQRWVQMLTGRPWPVKVIWIENVEPYDVAVMPIDSAVLDRGARKGLEVIRNVKRCIEAGEWPGVGGEEFLLHTPNWAMDDELEGAEEYEEAA